MTRGEAGAQPHAIVTPRLRRSEVRESRRLLSNMVKDVPRALVTGDAGAAT